MLNLRTLYTAVVLAFVLTTSVFAGDMHTGITDPPQAPQSIISTGVVNESAEDEATASDSVTDTALSLLQSVLSLF